jgi:hypothetical protein
MPAGINMLLKNRIGLELSLVVWENGVTVMAKID